MDPSSSILEIVQNKKTFTEDDCIQAINLTVDLLKQYTRTMTADSIGGIMFPDYSEGYNHWFDLNFWFSRGKVPLGKKIETLLDTRGFFFSNRAGDFLSPVKGRTRALVYGIDRNGRWIAVVIHFDRQVASDGVHCVPSGFDVNSPGDLFINGPSSLVHDRARFDNGLLVTYDQIRLNLLRIAENIFTKRERQYEEAQKLLQQMRACTALAGHIVCSVSEGS